MFKSKFLDAGGESLVFQFSETEVIKISKFRPYYFPWKEYSFLGEVYEVGKFFYWYYEICKFYKIPITYEGKYWNLFDRVLRICKLKNLEFRLFDYSSQNIGLDSKGKKKIIDTRCCWFENNEGYKKDYTGQYVRLDRGSRKEPLKYCRKFDLIVLLIKISRRFNLIKERVILTLI